MKVDMNDLFGTLYNKALEGDADCGGLMSYNFFAGEPVVGLDEGRPLFVRMPDSKFNLANFMRANLYASLEVLKVGMDILLKEEKVAVDEILGQKGTKMDPDPKDVEGYNTFIERFKKTLPIMKAATETMK